MPVVLANQENEAEGSFEHRPSWTMLQDPVSKTIKIGKKKKKRGR
jgi:hypothetical protein